MPRVSVIIPTYNRAPLLVQALESVFNQSFRDFEVIVADDGSQDKTAEAIKSFSDRLTYLPLEHTGLPAAARNAGLRAASGEYVVFLDSDDQWLETKLGRQIEVLGADSETGLVCANAVVMDSEALYLQPHQGHSGSVLKELFEDNFVITSTAVIRRTLLESAGLFSEDPSLCAIEDYDLWLRIAAFSKVHYIPEPLARYRTHPQQLGAQQPDSVHWQKMLKVASRLDHYLHEAGHAGQLPRDLLHDRLTTYQFALCQSNLEDKEFPAFIKHWAKLLVRNPRKSIRVFREPFRVIRGPKLHLGCGENYLKGYLNIDFPQTHHPVQRQTKPDLQTDLTTLSYPEDSIAEIRLHHVFEHFDRPTALRLLIDWYLWLREGGRLVIETPDFKSSIQTFLQSDSPKQAKILRHLFGSHEAGWATHKDAWYAAKFKLYLTRLGFAKISIKRSKWQSTENITVTAVKRRPLKTREQLMEAAEDLLRMSLIDDSETESRILQVWLARLYDEDSSHG